MKILAPKRLYRYTDFRLTDSGKRFAVGIMLDGDQRDLNNDLFIDQKVESHEKYLVHGRLDGTVCGGPVDQFTDRSGRTILNPYYNSDSAWLVGFRFFLDHPYGFGLKDRPDDYMCYLVDQYDCEDYSVSALFWINYQTGEKYKSAPYWIQVMSYTCLGVRVPGYSWYRNYYSNTNMERFQPSLSAAISEARRWLRGGFYRSGSSTLYHDENGMFTGKNDFDVSGYDVNRLPSIKNQFRFKEYQWVPLGPPISPEYELQHLRQSAFWVAINDVKVLNQNLVSSLVEAIQFLLKLKSGKFSFKKALPTSLHDSWLAYRYQFNTTRMDFKEGLEFIKWTGMFDLSTDTFFRGSANYNGKVCRCKVTLRSKLLVSLKKAWSTLYTYGLQPNFYLVWDMTPFSFIVDWFIPVGELCDIIDRYNYLTDTFDCVNCVYSLSYGVVGSTDNVTLNSVLYSRWIENRFPPVEFQYLYEDDSSSSKTILFRCLDAVSLILGRK